MDEKQTSWMKGADKHRLFTATGCQPVLKSPVARASCDRKTSPPEASCDRKTSPPEASCDRQITPPEASCDRKTSPPEKLSLTVW